jgi:molybdate transport system permease protein
MSGLLPPDEWTAVLLTLRVAAIATLAALPPGLALGWLFARRRFVGKAALETLVALPLVMPPVATGLVLLRLFGRRGPLGGALKRAVGVDIVFTWRAVVLAMAVMSLPLLVRGARIAFEGVPARLEAVARSLGASERRVFLAVTLPLAVRGIVGGLLLGFARALGEFGATIVVAGSIPGRTETLSLSIYRAIQLGDDAAAYRLLAVSALIALGAVFLSERLLGRTT